MNGEFLDLSSDPVVPATDVGGARGRNFLGVHFACCAVYARIYVNRNKSAYVGHCPKCGRHVRIKIGPEGTDHRFFTVS